MSADNGIYIAKRDNVYYIAYGAAVENLQYYPKGSAEREREFKDFFKNSLHASNGDTALHIAEDMAKEYQYLEYGIVYLQDFKDWE